MWDSSFMADMDNFSEINQNFDTIKTLLNSIRAQGILNTSDVDKLLTGINTKLEKINTEEDIDLIKIFLSELKQNFEERHSMLVSKFGAIESLFSNLLKNSSEMPKSAEIKELFDIVATNLSVFSREVVSQKDTLTDITLRLDALRSDDSQKKDIIKNIALLRPDLERLNNGFDSIVVSLNDNFKTIIKTISTIDKTEHLEKFSDSLNSIELSSNTILSALQVLDKKTEAVEHVISTLTTKEDLAKTNQRLFELNAQNQDISTVVTEISDKYRNIENLTDKVDASVNIIASLKSLILENEDKHASELLEQLRKLEQDIKEVSNDSKFQEVKVSLEYLLNKVADNAMLFDKNLQFSTTELQKINSLIESLGIDTNFKSLFNVIDKIEVNVKNSIDEVSKQLATLQDVNVTRILNDIASDADVLGAKLNEAQANISVLCETNFASVIEKVAELRKLISQIDENSVSANNAIFSSITDRLAAFENDLRQSLDLQEKNITNTSIQLIEQVDAIKSLSSVLDYKMDSSVVEVGNIKREFQELKKSVDDVLALNFVSTVKDLRVDLYASKQELVNSIENSNLNLSEKITNDIYGKYELLISKLDSVDDDFKKVQAMSLSELKVVLEKISSSVIDVLSYVSEQNTANNEQLDLKIAQFASALKENSLDYIETVRDIVEVIKVQVEENLKSVENSNIENFDLVKKVISENSDDIKKELKYSYSKLLEIQDLYNEIKENLLLNTTNITDKYDEIISTTANVKADYDSKLNMLKVALLDAISGFKQDFTCENADKVSELKFAVENLYNKNAKDIIALVEDLKNNQTLEFENREVSLQNSFKNLLDNLVEVKNLIDSLKENQIQVKESQEDNFTKGIGSLTDNLFITRDEIKTSFDDRVLKLSDSLTQAKEEINRSSLQINGEISAKTEEIISNITTIKTILDRVDENIDGDLTRQLSIIESNFEALVSQIAILFDKSDSSISEKINSEFEVISEKMQNGISAKLEDYKVAIENTFDKLHVKTIEQSQYLQERIRDFDEVLKSLWSSQVEENQKFLENITVDLKNVIDENIKLTAVDYVALKNKLNEYSKSIESNNQYLTQELGAKIDDITKYIDSILEIHSNENAIRNENLIKSNAEAFSKVEDSFNNIGEKINEQLNFARFSSADLAALSQMAANHNNLIEELVSSSMDKFLQLNEKQDLTNETLNKVELSTTNSVNLLETLKINLANLSQAVLLNKECIKNAEATISEDVSSLNLLISDNISKELDSVKSFFNKVYTQLTEQKQAIENLQSIFSQLLKDEFNQISSSIEKETDVIITELIEQFELLKRAQKDDVVSITSQIEDAVQGYIYNNVEDLKSYFDIKTDNTVLSSKLDLLKTELSESISDVIVNVSQLLDVNVFTSVISDFKIATELLINTSMESVNKKVESFIQENSLFLDERFNLLDKKFIETVVDKFEEVKIYSNQYKTTFESVQNSLSEILEDFDSVKTKIVDKIEILAQQTKEAIEATNTEIRALNNCFEDLRSQISNKSFDEAFQASINKQIASLEGLVREQLTYVEEINELCENSLPDVTELNTLVKHSILESIRNFSDKLDSNDIEQQLETLKSDIVTQILNLFNQISFVAEQEEILDFIQEKHDELISVLSHMVTDTSNGIDSIKNEIKNLNEKITSIISSEGDVDYIYSLHDLESDIANLRLVLNEMKENGHGQELAELINSTNEIYKLVEAIPNKSDFESMAEDIVSISTRTNKLILASDESYKTLHDNLQDFKLVINDLDERTRNFAQESGMDRIDSKLNAINSMMVNGAKTNQVFNQVFEYLAEWVDNAGVQINAISDKVETLSEIGQIKDMLIDLKAGAEDNTESEELVEALGTVFEKQAKRISALETKLDRIIVETTINNQNNKLDMSPLEDTLNRFLAAMDEKISAQQAKINSLEAKLEDVVQILEDKDTATLTKKVGGMDRQIAKLNKSIEKIASHVVEK